MALIAMAIWDTVENDRHKYTKQCLYSLSVATVLNNDIIFIDNNSTDERTKSLLVDYSQYPNCKVITLPENVGTARAINMALKLRKPGQHCIKIDNDVTWEETGWDEKLEECILRDPNIGVIGLKRKDLLESPYADNNWRSELHMLPHKPGETWLVVEKVNHVMGTCQMYNSALLDKIGYLKQFGLYGFDDSLICLRSQLAGFYNCFYPHFNIDHIDDGSNAYTQWKVKQADNAWAEYQKVAAEYINGSRPLWEDA